MNNPAGFDLRTYAATGEVVDVDPWAAMFNGNVWIQFAHLLPATYVVTGFLVASVYAVGWARGRRDRIHRLGMGVGLLVGCVAMPVPAGHRRPDRPTCSGQPAGEVRGDGADPRRPTSGVPMTLGGLYIDGEVVGAVEIPYLTSLILDFDPNSTIEGLDAVPPDGPPARERGAPSASS